MLERAAAHLAKARRVLVVTGAGVSAESGIPTFRGAGGLWEEHHPADLATPEAFARDPGLVWRWYGWRAGICRSADPNPAHLALVRLERALGEGLLLATQNVDALHRRAGSQRMVEIHGCIEDARCLGIGCHRISDLAGDFDGVEPPRCGHCGAPQRPHILWFGETYWPGTLDRALAFAQEAEFVLTVGTSGMVWAPIAIAEQAQRRGAFVVDLNPHPSELVDLADLWIQAPAGEALPALLDAAGIP